jgi:hypothetical protein
MVLELVGTIPAEDMVAQSIVEGTPPKSLTADRTTAHPKKPIRLKSHRLRRVLENACERHSKQVLK